MLIHENKLNQDYREKLTVSGWKILDDEKIVYNSLTIN